MSLEVHACIELDTKKNCGTRSLKLVKGSLIGLWLRHTVLYGYQQPAPQKEYGLSTFLFSFVLFKF